MDGLGNINWWGFSPCLDLLDLIHTHSNPPLLASNDDDDDKNTINILLLNAGDPRHILASLRSKREHFSSVTVRFFVYDKMLELYARDMLLASLALEHPSRTGLQEKTELFLDMFGNLLIREHTARLIRTRADELIRLVTDLDAMQKTALGVFDLSLLKFKERDYLEGVLKYWRLKDDDNDENEKKELKTSSHHFPASKCWDARLRAYFGQRYDSRSNAYDWDFAMKLSDRKHGSIVNNRVYARWRETGVAFELRDADYSKPNRTLSSALVMNDPRNGDKTARRGFFGDIVVGPFVAFGIRRTDDNDELFKKQNDIYRYTSMDISKSNVNELMESVLKLGGIDNFKKFDPLKDSPARTGAKLEEIREDAEMSDANETKSANGQDQDYLKIDKLKIVFMPLTSIQDFASKPKYEQFFHAVYMSNTAAAHMSKQLAAKILKPNAMVVFETAKFMLEMSNEQIAGFSQRLEQIGAECGLTRINECSKSTSRTEDKQATRLETEDFYLFKYNESNTKP